MNKLFLISSKSCDECGIETNEMLTIDEENTARLIYERGFDYKDEKSTIVRIIPKSEAIEILEGIRDANINRAKILTNTANQTIDMLKILSDQT